MPGHPDWQSIPQWHSDPFIAAAGHVIAAGLTTVYDGPVAQFGGLQLDGLSATGPAYWRVRWYADSSFTVLLYSDTFAFSNHTDRSVFVPVFGPFAIIELGNDLTTAVTATVYATGLMALISAYEYPVNSREVGASPASLAAGGTVSFYPSLISRGPATLYVAPGSPSGVLKVKVIEIFRDGTTGPVLWEADAISASMTQQLSIPDTLWRMDVSNTGTVAVNNYAAILVVPGSAG
jgi:hypothetical protein